MLNKFYLISKRSYRERPIKYSGILIVSMRPMATILTELQVDRLAV